MKAHTIFALAVVAMLLLPIARAQSIDEPRFVNRMLGDFSTPSIEPGEAGQFYFSVNNPDPFNLTGRMENAVISVSIYHYATLEESLPIGQITNPPVFSGNGTTSTQIYCGSIPPGGEFPIPLTIITDRDTPHGSYFSQSSYFVRFMLSFEYLGQNYTMASRGHFTDEEWEALKSGNTGAGEINQTYLHELGYDGIIPDSAFSVRKDIPLWPAYILAGLTVLSGLTAFSYFVLDNPGKYPRLEIRLLRITGKMNLWKRTVLRRFKKSRKDTGP